MRYAVVVQPRRHGGFVASVPALPGCRSHGTTEGEVLMNMHTAIARHLKRAKIFQVEVEDNGAATKNPWDSIIGMFENDSIFDDVEREIKRARVHPKNKARKKK